MVMRRPKYGISRNCHIGFRLDGSSPSFEAAVKFGSLVRFQTPALAPGKTANRRRAKEGAPGALENDMSEDGLTWHDSPCSVETVYDRPYPDPCQAHREVQAIIIRPMHNFARPKGDDTGAKVPEGGDGDGG